MTPYGQALLLLALDALKDTRGDDLARALTASAQRKGDLAWWSVDERPAARRLRRHQRRGDGVRREGAGGARPEEPAARAGGALAAAQPQLRRLVGEHQADGDGALRPARLHDARGRKAARTPASRCSSTARRPASHTFTPASLTAPDPVVVTAPAAAGRNTIEVRKKGGGTRLLVGAAEYYDTAGGAGAHRLAQARAGQRQVLLAHAGHASRTGSSTARRRSTAPRSRATCCSCASTRPGRTTGGTW